MDIYKSEHHFLKNIQYLESATGCFTCSICLFNSNDSCLTSCPGSQTSDSDLFSFHLDKYHKPEDKLLCLYCGSLVFSTDFVNHVSSHLFYRLSVSDQAIYSCPLGSKCLTKYSSNTLHHIVLHWNSRHAIDKRDLEQCEKPRCTHCQTVFKNVYSWFEHLKQYSCLLAHCPMIGCLVKSPSRQLVWNHIHQKHVGFCSSKDKNINLIRETIELTCSANNSHASSSPSSSSKATNSCLQLSPSVVLLLRCPHCRFCTIRWPDFLMHPYQCPFDQQIVASCPTDAHERIYRCTLYWCSICRAISTEYKLVHEHIWHEHNSKATVVEDHFNVSLADSNDKDSTVSMDLSLKCGNVVDPNSTLAFSSNENSTIAFTHVDPPKPTILVTTCDRKNNDLPTTNSSLAMTSAVTNSTTSIFNPSATLNTLHQLHSRSDIDPNAASAVAVMAAAALSNLTSKFDSFHTSLISNTSDIFAHTLSVCGTISSSSNTTITTTTQSSNHHQHHHHNRIMNHESKLVDNNIGPISVTKREASFDAGVAASDESTGNDSCALPLANGRATNDGLVTFPFDETKFRNELAPHMRADVLNMLVSKMQQFSSYLVRILGKENHRRIPVCPECDKVFPYGLGDFKRHLLTVHLEVPREYLKDCLKFTYLPKSEEKFQELQEQLAMRQMKPKYLKPGLRRVPLPYSISLLRKLISHLPFTAREFLEQKMQYYSRLSVIVDFRNGFHIYKCNHCSYQSSGTLEDVCKHALASHCNISTKHIRYCLQASRLDPTEFVLLSDENLTRLVKDFMNRQIGDDQNHDSLYADSLAPFDDENENCTEYGGFDAQDHLDNKDLLSNVNGHHVKHKKKLGSRNLQAKSSLSTCSKTNETHCSDESDTDLAIQALPNEKFAANSQSNASSILDGADSMHEVSLPFSEPVLRHLLEASGAPGHYIENIVTKMHIYSTYKMTRICCQERTVAFRCSCGRLFITTRQPDSKIRASTLADSRRHVMGVHARIPNVFITICCQASRITRDYDFQLYPDYMLLRLAMDRPIKLNDLSLATLPRHSALNSPTKSDGVLTGNQCNSSKYAKSKHAKTPALNCDKSHSQQLEGHLPTDVELGCRQSEEPMVVVKRYKHANSDLFALDSQNGANGDGRKRLVRDMDEDPLGNLKAIQALDTEDVERIIDLPYSVEALKNLVQGYCPPNYFPILEAKMNVYSSLKVFVTRRHSRRYFCCSRCPAASPHGMGDIRKHILGVHAKVPERYKAAAMHCSRLSREDNTLLPNHVLLHLAKMKWKGTVIKPLSEMDLSQFGTRRASAVGLTRPTNSQFASQVYQPTTHLDSMDKRITSKQSLHVSASNSVSNNNNSSNNIITNNTNTNSNNSNYSCSSHNSSSSSNSSATSSTSSKDVSPKFNYYKCQNSNEAFELSSFSQPSSFTESNLLNSGFYIIRQKLASNSSENTFTYTCSVCSYSSNYIGALRTHIVQIHVGLSAQKCVYCQATFKMHKDLVDHHEQVHPDLVLLDESYSTNYQQIMSKIAVRDECDSDKMVQSSTVNNLDTVAHVDDNDTELSLEDVEAAEPKATKEDEWFDNRLMDLSNWPVSFKVNQPSHKRNAQSDMDKETYNKRNCLDRGDDDNEVNVEDSDNVDSDDDNNDEDDEDYDDEVDDDDEGEGEDANDKNDVDKSSDLIDLQISNQKQFVFNFNNDVYDSNNNNNDNNNNTNTNDKTDHQCTSKDTRQQQNHQQQLLNKQSLQRGSSRRKPNKLALVQLRPDCNNSLNNCQSSVLDSRSSSTTVAVGSTSKPNVLYTTDDEMKSNDYYVLNIDSMVNGIANLNEFDADQSSHIKAL